MTATKSAAQLISCMAAQNRPAQKDWDLSDLKLFHALRLLYAEHKMLLVDTQQAKKEKEQLILEWRKEKTL